MEVTEGADVSAPAAAAVDRARNLFRHERAYTLMTGLIGLMLGAGTTLLVRAGLMGLAADELTPLSWLREVVIYVVLFDAYFYTIHRLFHTRWMYRHIHSIHHRSTSPTLLTALAFHPIEALMIMGFVPVAMALLPIHFGSLVTVSIFLSGSILIAHCGYQVFPRWFSKVPLLNWYVTPRVHDEHHKRRNCNYAATISIFDRAFRTLRQEE